MGVVRRPRLLAAALAGGGLVAVVVLGLVVRIQVVAEEIDVEWMAEIVEKRAPGWEAIARVFDVLGGGWVAILVVPLGVAVALLVARRPWAALVFVATSAASALLVQGLKVAFGRARPEEILLPLDSGAFPSGHVANAATIATLLALLLTRWWVAAAGAAYVALMALSRTYLGAHWLTDTVGGALLGAAVAVLAVTVAVPRLSREREARAARHPAA